jgi:outer membrane protein assembly factor BamB
MPDGPKQLPVGALLVAIAALASGPILTGQGAGAALALLPAEEVWQIRLADLPSASGAMDAARVYVPLTSGDVAALERATGALVWTQRLESRSAPLADGQALYVAAADGLHALDPSTGESRWTAPLDASTREMILAADDLLVVPLRTGGLAAMRRVDGRPAWTQALEGRIVTSLAADAGTLYAASADGQVTAIATDEGRVRWQRPLTGSPAPPALARDRVFIGTTGSSLFALNPRNGRPRWRWSLGGTVAGVVADDDFVYVATLDNLLRAFNRGNGHERWRQPLATRPLAPPRLAGDHLVVTGVDPAISLFLAATGTPVGTYAAPDQTLVQGEPLIDPQPDSGSVTIVLVLRDGRVIGLRSQSTSSGD